MSTASDGSEATGTRRPAERQQVHWNAKSVFLRAVDQPGGELRILDEAATPDQTFLEQAEPLPVVDSDAQIDVARGASSVLAEDVRQDQITRCCAADEVVDAQLARGRFDRPQNPDEQGVDRAIRSDG